MVIVKKAGQPAPKLDQFASEDVTYVFDLKEVLDPMELAVKFTPPEYDGLAILSARSLGTTAEVRIKGTPLDTSAYKDYNISIPYLTSMNNTRVANFGLRIYK